MEEFIIRYWLQVLFAALAGLFGTLFVRAKTRNDKLKSDVDLLKNGMRVWLRHEITKSFHYHMRQGCIIDDDLRSFLDMCDMQSELGGNGTTKSMRERVKRLKIVDAIAYPVSETTDGKGADAKIKDTL